MSRRFAFAVFSLLLACLGCSKTEPAPRPNIVYIMTDDHSARMMSAYGPGRMQTPNLDRIAAGGALFENSFVTNALCAPSRATLLTGKYSHSNGQLSNADTFDGSQQTFPKLLQAAGYQTAMIGKWHLKSDPTGFDYWNILPGQGVYVDPTFIEMGERKQHTGYVTNLITDFAIDWIRNRDAEKPFLLLYHHKAPHGQWVPDEKHGGLFSDADIPTPESFGDDLSGRAEAIRRNNSRLVPELAKRWSGWGDLGKQSSGDLEGEALNEWMYQQYVKDYMRVMVSVDENVGRFLDFLDESGLTEDTLVIYTSDNGMFLGEHFLFDKRLMLEEAQRVPLAVRYPRAVKPGQRLQAFSLNVDYAPTMLDYAGVAVPADMQGRSLRPVLEGPAPSDWRKSIYYHYWEWPTNHQTAPHYGVRTDRYKLIHHYDPSYGGPTEWELIDLEKDPNETRNIYGDPAYADVQAELHAELDRLRTDLQAPPLPEHSTP